MAWQRWILGIGLFGVVLATTACQLRNRGERELPLPEGVQPEEVIDGDYPSESISALTPESLLEAAQEIRASRKPDILPERKYNVLCLSGGGVYGAYSAGILGGWTATGQRPVFDVVTGISTGALIAPFAFLGPAYDNELKKDYTTIDNDDIFRRRRFYEAIFSDSVADTGPLRQRIQQIATPQVIRAIADEHAKGRRLYIGSTNIDTKRLVVWDIGAICVKGGVAAREMIVDILLASSAIPGFFPPVEIPINIDGRNFTELHVDGGMTRELFFRTPYVEPSKRESFGPETLWNSNIYVLVAGKLYADPQPVRRRTLAIAGSAISGLLYTNTRGDIDRLFNYTLLTGMNLYVSAIPSELEVTTNATDFDPVEMTMMYNAGYQNAVQGLYRMGSNGQRQLGPAWQVIPPGLARKAGEEEYTRSGTRLTVRMDPDVPLRIPTPGGDFTRPGLPSSGLGPGPGQSAIPAIPGAPIGK